MRQDRPLPLSAATLDSSIIYRVNPNRQQNYLGRARLLSSRRGLERLDRSLALPQVRRRTGPTQARHPESSVVLLEIHLELVAEKDFADEGILGDFARRTGHDDVAFVDDVGTVGGLQSLADVVIGD